MACEFDLNNKMCEVYSIHLANEIEESEKERDIESFFF